MTSCCLKHTTASGRLPLFQATSQTTCTVARGDDGVPGEPRRGGGRLGGEKHKKGGDRRGTRENASRVATAFALESDASRAHGGNPVGRPRDKGVPIDAERVG